MPTLENTVPVVSDKYLRRKTNRSSVIFANRRAAFFGNAIPRLERAQKVLHERLCVLREPVERIADDGSVVREHDDKSLCAVIRGLIDVIDAERQLLGFPSPGRRRNEDTQEIAARVANVVEQASDVSDTTVRHQPSAPSEQAPSSPITS